jgi:hypothetical protein
MKTNKTQGVTNILHTLHMVCVGFRLRKGKATPVAWFWQEWLASGVNYYISLARK